MALTSKQKGVRKGIVIALVVTVSGFFSAIWFFGGISDASTTLGDRLAFVARWDLLVVVWLLGAIGTLARHRFFTSEDIDGGGLTMGTDKPKVYQAFLQNTLEQVVLALIVHVSWVLTMPGNWLGVIPVAVVFFFVGRGLFLRGYALGAGARAVGFGLTFYPTVLMFLTMAGYAAFG